jgi:hypothetical protein
VTPERLAEIREQVEKLREHCWRFRSCDCSSCAGYRYGRLMVVDLLDSRDALVEALKVISNHETGNMGRTARAALRDAGEPE